MRLYIKYLGYSKGKYQYSVLSESGIADRIALDFLCRLSEVESDDALWSESSGWADIDCEQCGHQYRDRTYPGGIVSCPVCDYQEQTPLDAILEGSNLCD